jgi:hypothetical protein
MSGYFSVGKRQGLDVAEHRPLPISKRKKGKKIFKQNGRPECS